jgi:hypothetical protein
VCLFSAAASAGGSGSLTTLALLEYGPQDLTDLFAGQIQLTELGFDQFLSVAGVSDALIFVTATGVWATDECHFCPHRYTIKSYVYNAQTGRYALRDHYTTTKKYAMDAHGATSVLKSEQSQIESRLRKVAP